MTFLPRLAVAAGLFLGLAGATLAPLAAAAQGGAVSPEQRKAIEAIVRDYLIANPEVIQDALTELERRQQDAQKTAQRRAIREEQAALVTSPRNAVVGNPAGDVTIVEFMDYNCGFCKRGLADLDAMLKADPKLRIVLKDFPVLGPDSVEAAQVAVAVKSQLKGDKFWAFHVKLMETRGRVGRSQALAVAKEMGADMARLERDLQSAEVRETIAETVSLGDKLGLTGTPAYIIGEEVVFGAVGKTALTRTVAGVRQCGRATC